MVVLVISSVACRGVNHGKYVLNTMLVLGSLGSRGHGISASPPQGCDAEIINCTSSSAYRLPSGRKIRECVSPFFIGPSFGFPLFENWWQGGRVWPEHLAQRTPPVLNAEWTKFHEEMKKQIEPVRHPPKLFGLIGNAVLGYYSGVFYDYVASRYLYALEYRRLVEDPRFVEAVVYLRSLLATGKNILLLDFDGPPAHDFRATKKPRPPLFHHGVTVTQESFDAFIMNPEFRFGHGWVLAASILGLNIPDLISKGEDTHSIVTSIVRPMSPEMCRAFARATLAEWHRQ